MLPSLVRFPARPPRHAHFGIQSIDPVHLLSTLQTPRYHDACKTRCWSVCSTLTRPDFHRQVDTSFPNALPDNFHHGLCSTKSNSSTAATTLPGYCTNFIPMAVRRTPNFRRNTQLA